MIKAILSLFIVWHLLVILIMPNSSSIIGRVFADHFLIYANTLGLNTTWQFFSPGPARNYFIEYTAESDAVIDSESNIFPKKEQLWSDAFNRRMYAMRFLTTTDQRMKDYFVPWLCHENPQAEGVSVRKMFDNVPEIQKMSDENFADSTQRENLKSEYFVCDKEM